MKNEKLNITTLSDRDRDALLALLDSDDEPNEELKKAAEVHRKLIEQSDPEIVGAIEEGMASFARGEGRPAKEALGELAKKYDIPR